MNTTLRIDAASGAVAANQAPTITSPTIEAEQSTKEAISNVMGRSRRRLCNGMKVPFMNKRSNWLADPCHQTVGLDVPAEYAIGETNFERWGRLWKACASDPELDGEEWVIFLELFQEHLRNNYENFPDEFYFWGDFSGDRTLDLRIANPTVVTTRLLSDLQEYLQINGRKMWRIRIPIYFKPNDFRRVVVIYPYAIVITAILPSST